jgi:hypothetical protein
VLIWPPTGLSNSTVPNRFAVTGKRSVSTNDVWPPAGRLITLDPIGAPVSPRIRTGTLAAWVPTFATATRVTRPLVLSKANKYEFALRVF